MMLEDALAPNRVGGLDTDANALLPWNFIFSTAWF